MIADEEMCEEEIPVLPTSTSISTSPTTEIDEIQELVEIKTSHGIQVSITANEDSEAASNPLYVIDLSLSQTSWKVTRDLSSFQELYQRLLASEMLYTPLPENENVSAASLQYFLQAILTDNGDKIWYCRYITGFIDNQKPSEIKVLQVDVLTKQFCEVSTKYNSASAKLQDAWRMIVTLAQRSKSLEASHLRIHNSFKPKEEGVPPTPFEIPLLAGIYRFEDIMAQASEFLKDETDWIVGEDGGFVNSVAAEVVPIVIPDPPPVVHTYSTCTLLSSDLIPVNEEKDMRDEAIGSVISLLEPHQAQVSYRNSVRAFFARVVRRTLCAKVYETGLHALDCFLPDDPMRLTVLLGRTNVCVENGISSLNEKLFLLADQSSEMGKALLSELMQPVDDDFMAGEDIQPLSEHSVSRVTVNSSKIFCDVDLPATNLEIDINNLSGVRFLSFLDEVAQLVGKEELFKRSLLLIRGWWVYEASTYLGVFSKNFLTDHALCVLIVSIFNQHHTTLHHPLQVLSVFLAEYSELDWANCAVSIQGVVPFRPCVPEPEIAPVTANPTEGEDTESPTTQSPTLSTSVLSPVVSTSVVEGSINITTTTTTSNVNINTSSSSNSTNNLSEPWMRYPKDTDLISASMLLKYTEPVKVVKPSTPTPIQSSGSKSPVQSASSYGASMYNFTAMSPLDTPLSHISPQSRYRELDSNVMNLTLLNSENVSESTSGTATAGVLTPCGSAIVKQPSADLENIDSPLRKSVISPPVEAFQRSAMNIIHPLQQLNLVPLAMPVERVAKIVQIFEVGTKNLTQALKASQGDEISCQSAFNRFFKAVLLRFVGGWRPDVFSGAHSMCHYGEADGGYNGDWNSQQADSDTLAVTKSKCSQLQPEPIWNQVCYMDLVLTGCVSESAVLALSKEILFERGTLPVGEIGKVLQELTCASSFLGKLKEKFGGLKKFLERFPEEFMICTDHPFNPHVFVKKALNAEELEMVAKGTVPPHLTAKYKKAQRNKKAKPPATGSQSVSPSMTHRTLVNGTSMSQSYNGTIPAASYRSSPSTMQHSLASRAAMAAGSASSSSFNQMQLLQQQQQQSQFYNPKGHPSQPYPSPGVSSRSRASLSQSLLRASASSTGGYSLGGSSYHQPSSSHSAFQTSYSSEGVQPLSRPGAPSSNYPVPQRDNYSAIRSGSLGMGMVGDRGSDPYGAERDSLFGLNAPRGGGRSLSAPNVTSSPYSGYNMQHDQSIRSLGSGSSIPGSERGFPDSSRDPHQGLFPSPISSQHISYDNSSLNSSYDSESRSFPSHTIANTGPRSSNTFLRGLEPPQTLSTTSSPMFSTGGALPKGLTPGQTSIEAPSSGPKYGNFLRPSLHDLDQSSPAFTPQLPSPKFDVSKWV